MSDAIDEAATIQEHLGLASEVKAYRSAGRTNVQRLVIGVEEKNWLIHGLAQILRDYIILQEEGNGGWKIVQVKVIHPSVICARHKNQTEKGLLQLRGSHFIHSYDVDQIRDG